MAEILFYHLTRTPLEVTLPELLGKTLGRGWKAVVRSGAEDRLAWLDDRLWTGGDAAEFLPHARAGGADDASQPILLTTEAGAPNGADILFAVDGATVSTAEAGEFNRVCVLFDGNDPAALDMARQQWKQLTDAGLPSKYWSQEIGNWQVKASKNI